MGIGGLIGFLMVMSHEYQLNYNATLALLFLLAGLIGMARIGLNAHKPSEVYIGFLLGWVAQFLSYLFYQNM